jgi:hypothetical protein
MLPDDLPVRLTPQASSSVSSPARAVWSCAIGLLAFGLLAAGSRANASIRPHQGIGRLTLGMTLTEVKRVLGRPMLVNRRVNRGFGRVYVEYAWDYGFWIVGFHSERGRSRVVRISTMSRAARTSEGVGIGSRVSEVVRRYPSARCRDMFPLGRWITVQGPGGRQTIFVVRSERKAAPHPQPVSEVIVQQPVPAYGVRLAFQCRAGWQRR